MNAIAMITKCAERSQVPVYTDLSVEQHREVTGGTDGWINERPAEFTGPSDAGIDGHRRIEADAVLTGEVD